jgi:hypothetical protein
MTARRTLAASALIVAMTLAVALAFTSAPVIRAEDDAIGAAEWSDSTGVHAQSTLAECLPNAAFGGEIQGEIQGLAETLREALRDALPTPAPTLPPVVASPNPAPLTAADAQATLRLCAGNAAQHQTIARALETLIAGRAFSLTLTSRADGCADLTVLANGPSVAGRSTSQLSVGLSNTGQRLSVRVTSEAGVTHVAIDPAA